MAGKFFFQTRALIATQGGVFNLSHTMDTVEQNFNDGLMGDSIGQCKNLIESLSKTILEMQSLPYDNNIKFPKLAKEAIKAISVEGVGNDDQKTRNAFLGIATGICKSIDSSANSLATLRNDYSTVAHGQSSSHIDLPTEYAKFIILQTDAVLHFMISLLKRHKDYKPPLVFNDNEDYNDVLYEQFGGIEIFGDLYLTPEILDSLNPEKYREKLNEFRATGELNYDE